MGSTKEGLSTHSSSCLQLREKLYVPAIQLNLKKFNLSESDKAERHSLVSMNHSNR